MHVKWIFRMVWSISHSERALLSLSLVNGGTQRSIERWGEGAWGETVQLSRGRMKIDNGSRKTDMCPVFP